MLDLPPLDSPELAHIAEDLRPLARPLDELMKDAANLRLHDDESIDAIAGSIAEFMQHKNVVVQVKPNGAKVVRAGNGTIDALYKLGKKWVAAVYIEEDDVAAVRRAIADNRAAEKSRWDLVELNNVLPTLGIEPVPGVDPWFLDVVHQAAEAVPAFSPAGEGDQSQLDELSPKPCPHCQRDTRKPPSFYEDEPA